MYESPEKNGLDALPPAREIDLLRYVAICRKRAFLILAVALLGLCVSLGATFLMGERFMARAVISPVKEGPGSSGGMSILVQQLETVPGMSFSSPSSSSEILALLNSSMLRRRAIETYGLMPAIFSRRWDVRKKGWTGDGAPTIHDALRTVDKALSVRHSPKDNTITMTYESASAHDAAAFLDALIAVLNKHLGDEARRLADSNRRYLEGQLKYASDPLIRQNIYTLIAQQIESSMMAGVMENFAFKVIDPPEAPDKRSSPRRALIAIFGGAASLGAGVLLAFSLEFSEARKKRLDNADKGGLDG